MGGRKNEEGVWEGGGRGLGGRVRKGCGRDEG